jgi:hypothetical protein
MHENMARGKGITLAAFTVWPFVTPVIGLLAEATGMIPSAATEPPAAFVAVWFGLTVLTSVGASDHPTTDFLCWTSLVAAALTLLAQALLVPWLIAVSRVWLWVQTGKDRACCAGQSSSSAGVKGDTWTSQELVAPQVSP